MKEAFIDLKLDSLNKYHSFCSRTGSFNSFFHNISLPINRLSFSLFGLWSNGGPACITYSCMYMYVCMNVCISLYMYVFMHACMIVCMYVSMNTHIVCKYLCMYVRMYQMF